MARTNTSVIPLALGAALTSLRLQTAKKKKKEKKQEKNGQKIKTKIKMGRRIMGGGGVLMSCVAVLLRSKIIAFLPRRNGARRDFTDQADIVCFKREAQGRN